CQHGFGIPYSF
nr:immunoglobulin light chain junction region [Macaca mulatta]MOV61914.1 immunoglobulin light chain junction region [Macaca mulatta]